MSGRGGEPGADGRRRAGCVVVLGLANVPGLRPLRAIDDLELDGLTLLQGPEAVATDGRVVDKHIASTLALNEPVALGVIEPLDLACNTHRSSSLLALDLSFETQKKTASAASWNSAARTDTAAMQVTGPYFVKITKKGFFDAGTAERVGQNQCCEIGPWPFCSGV